MQRSSGGAASGFFDLTSAISFCSATLLSVSILSSFLACKSRPILLQKVSGKQRNAMLRTKVPAEPLRGGLVTQKEGRRVPRETLYASVGLPRKVLVVAHSSAWHSRHGAPLVRTHCGVNQWIRCAKNAGKRCRVTGAMPSIFQACEVRF
jgi:hypothetical protein